ncbi:GNAT family N-acetyltransferase [Pantoea ananatis]|uniref:GNAT family N-acetyltransferase n=1 Tax=Pantoea ananas TaxID=553 RepID=UPI00235097EB|nr:GNAT family N-acetyltransferase [Pantoea ananatis]MDC7860679.1 acetyltransferase [Pantoea ananatis]
MEIIKLEKYHLKEVYDIRFSVTENPVHQHQIQYLQRAQALDDIGQGGGWICKVGDEFVGYGFGIYIPHPLIGGLFVRPEHQGKSVGTQLLGKITDWFFGNGNEVIELTTDPNSGAVTFYEKNGWVREGLDEFGQQIMKKHK